MQPILKPPLVYALLIKGAAKSPTKPSPSPHTPQTKQNSWKWGPLEKEGSQGAGWDNYRKERGDGGASTEAIPLNSIGCVSCCGPVTLRAPTLTAPLSLPPSHSGNYDIYYRGEVENRGGDSERSTGIWEGRAYHKWEACTSWYTNTTSGKHGWKYTSQSRQELWLWTLIRSPLTWASPSANERTNIGFSIKPLTPGGPCL